MTKDEIRMKLWRDVYSKTLDTKYTRSGAVNSANNALEAFDAGSAESSEPVDEPRTVWVTFWDDEPDESYGTLYEANNACEVRTNLSGYAEFQQVGPMVRRDDEKL